MGKINNNNKNGRRKIFPIEFPPPQKKKKVWLDPRLLIIEIMWKLGLATEIPKQQSFWLWLVTSSFSYSYYGQLPTIFSAKSGYNCYRFRLQALAKIFTQSNEHQFISITKNEM